MNEDKNMELWESVCHSNPGSLKQFTMPGGFKGTAIAAYHQIQKATEVWGPYGKDWGLRHCTYTTVSETKDVVGSIVLEGEFYYPDGHFTMAVDQEYYANRNTYKKLTTDLLTKCLSMLGFNADVFLNQMKFEHNQYINLTEKDKPEPKPEKVTRWQNCKIHFGKLAGKTLKELSPKQLEWFRDQWACEESDYWASRTAKGYNYNHASVNDIELRKWVKKWAESVIK